MSCPFFIYTWQSSLLLVATGVFLGALGLRGAWLVLPTFLLALRVPLDLAVPAATAVVGFVALSGTWDAVMERRLDLRRSVRFGIPVAAISASVSYVVGSRMIPPSILLWSFLALAIAAGLWTMARNVSSSILSPEGPSTDSPSLRWGALNGILVGLFGIGAPPSSFSRRISDAAIVPPVLLVGIALGSAASLAVHIPSGTFRWTMALPAVLAVTLGMELGAWTSRKIPVRVLEITFGAMLAALSIALVWRLSLS